MTFIKVVIILMGYFVIIGGISQYEHIDRIDFAMAVLGGIIAVVKLTISQKALEAPESSRDVIIFRADRFAANWWIVIIVLGYFGFRFYWEQILTQMVIVY